MARISSRLAHRLWVDFDMLPAADRSRLLVNLSGALFSLPWLVIGFAWLGIQIDLHILITNWALLLFILVLSLVIERLPILQFINMGGENYGSNSSDLSDIVLISGYFIFGPAAVILLLGKTLIAYGLSWSEVSSHIHRWTWLRNFLFNLGIPLVAILAGLAVYEAAGGTFPLSGLQAAELAAAVVALLLYWLFIALLMLLMWLVMFRSGSGEASVDGVQNGQPPPAMDKVALYRQSSIFLIGSYFPGVFGILAAVLYTRIGLWAFLFYFMGVFLVNFLARRMSLAVMVSQQKTRELDQLEQLGRAIIAAPADASRLPDLLEEHLPAMLSYQQLSVQLFDGRSLVNLPEKRPALDEQLWSYFQDDPKPLEIFPGETHPWSQETSQDRYVLMPILSTDTQVPIGGICLVQEVYIFAESSIDIKPALQVLAAQIASALHASEVFTETLEHQKIAQEMAFAGRIQNSFLPHVIPEIKGWRISAALEPARETSGDFYDLIQLPGNRFAIVVADVTDKGMGAALFMALSRTLIRTYAIEYPRETARVMAAANERIISDATAGLFVTAFYGVLDTSTGELTYANAGHNPPYHIRPGMEVPVTSLKGTGMALGLMEDAVWEQGTVLLESRDSVVLYSDGITEANNPAGSFYGDDRLVSISLANADRPAEEMQEQILSDLRSFVDAAPQSDDITLLVLKRE